MSALEELRRSTEWQVWARRADSNAIIPLRPLATPRRTIRSRLIFTEPRQPWFRTPVRPFRRKRLATACSSPPEGRNCLRVSRRP